MSLIGERIKEVRESQGLGRSRFSQKTDIPEQTLRKIENGGQRATEDAILSICSIWPEFAYWLTTGMTQPENGHISPEIYLKTLDSDRDVKAGG